MGKEGEDGEKVIFFLEFVVKIMGNKEGVRFGYRKVYRIIKKGRRKVSKDI